MNCSTAGCGISAQHTHTRVDNGPGREENLYVWGSAYAGDRRPINKGVNWANPQERLKQCICKAKSRGFKYVMMDDLGDGRHGWCNGGEKIVERNDVSVHRKGYTLTDCPKPIAIPTVSVPRPPSPPPPPSPSPSSPPSSPSPSQPSSPSPSQPTTTTVQEQTNSDEDVYDIGGFEVSQTHALMSVAGIIAVSDERGLVKLGEVGSGSFDEEVLLDGRIELFE
eukprot:1862147-Prymnesium_polylepis.1